MKREHELIKRLLEVNQEIIDSETPEQKKLKNKEFNLAQELGSRIKNEYDIDIAGDLRACGNSFKIILPENKKIKDEDFNRLAGILGFTDSYIETKNKIIYGFFTDWEYAPEELKELVK